MIAMTNPVFIQYRNVNSTLSENVYIAFGTVFSAVHDRVLIYVL